MVKTFYFEIHQAPSEIPARPIQPIRADFFVAATLKKLVEFQNIFSRPLLIMNATAAKWLNQTEDTV